MLTNPNNKHNNKCLLFMVKNDSDYKIAIFTSCSRFLQWLGETTHIWSNFMRTHIGLKICHFLPSVVSITEGPENKIMRKSGIHSSFLCSCSTLEQFLFYRVSRKNAKKDIFLSGSYSTILLSKQYFSHKREAPRNTFFFNFFGYPAKQKLF